MEKLIITVSPSGRAANLSSQPDMRDPQEQAQATVDAWNAGASVVHIRGSRRTDPPGSREPDLKNWGAIASLIRSRTDIIVNFGSAAMPPEVRRKLLELKPEAGSFLTGHHFSNMLVPIEDQQEAARYHLEAGVLPEVEIFRSGDIWNMRLLIEAGLLQPPYCSTLFFNWEGNNWAPPTLLELQSRLAILPPGTDWTVCARGPEHLPMLAHAIMLGGHVRTGLEDNVELAPGRPAQSNAELVARVVSLARDLGREVATPQEARTMLGLPRTPLDQAQNEHGLTYARGNAGH